MPLGKKYTIGEVEALTNLTARRIRYYEQAGLISPERTAGGQRRYSEADINRLETIKRLLEENTKLADVKTILEDMSNQDEPNYSQPGNAVFAETHDVLTKAGEMGQKLTSLYPVSDRAELIRQLRKTRIESVEKFTRK